MAQSQADLQREQLPGVAKGAAFGLMFQFLDKGFGFVFVILVPSLIGLTNFGIFNICVSVAHISAILAMAGLPHGLVREGSALLEKEEWGRFFGLIRFCLVFTLVVSGGAALLITLFARPLAEIFLDDATLSWTFRVIAVAVPFISLTVILVQLATVLRVVRLSAIIKNFFEPSLKIAFFVFLFAVGYRLGAVIFGFTVTFVTCFAVALIMAIRLKAKLPRVTTGAFDGRTLLRYSLPLLGPMLFANLLVWMDILLLGYYAENAVVGLFSLTLKIMLIPEVIQRSFALPVAPRLAAMLKRDHTGDWQSFYRQVGRWIFALSLPFYLFFIVRSDLTLRILGERFVAGSEYLSILCIGPLLLPLIGPADILLAMAGKSNLQLFNTLVAFGLNLLANVTFLPQYGAAAMAWIMSGTVIFYGILMAIQISWMYRFVPVSAKVLRLTMTTLPALGALFWLRFSPPLANPYYEFLLEGTIFFVLYFGAVLIWDFDAEDRDVVLHMILRIRDHLAEVRHASPTGKFL